MVDQPFDVALAPQIDALLTEVEKAGVPVLDKKGKNNWVKDKVTKGFSFKLILEKLKEYNYDFAAAGSYFDGLSSGKDKAETALKEVQGLKEEKVKEEKKKKFSSRLALIVTSFILGGAGFFTWNMFRKTTSAITDVNLLSGPTGGLLSSFDKGAFIVGIAGVSVGVLLTFFVLAEYLVKKGKEEKKEEGPSKEELAMKEKQMEQELKVAEQISEQKIQPPEIVS